MPKTATVVLVVLLGTGCTTQMARMPLQAMLLPPVDGKLALWINKPAYFAVLGVGAERGTEVVYQQTALEGVPASGYVYVPTRGDPDADYEAVERVFASSQMVDGYEVADTVDRMVCDNRAILPHAGYAKGPVRSLARL